MRGRMLFYSILPLVFATGLYFFANIQRVAIPGAIFDQLQVDLDLSAAGVAALGSAFMYVYAANQLVVGLLVNRYGGRRVILPGALLFCLGSFWFPYSDGIWIFVSRGLTGLGASTLYLALIDDTIRTFRKNYAIAISFVIMIGYAGGITANAPLVAGVGVFGWQNVFTWVAGLSGVFYLLYALSGFGKKLPPVQTHIPLHFSSYFHVLKSGHNRAIFLFSGINFGLYYVIQTVIGKKFLEDFCEIGTEHAAWFLSLMGAISAGGGVLLAFLSRLTGNRRLIFCRIAGVVCLTVFLTALLLVLCDVRSGGVVLLFCLLATTGSMSSIVIPLLHETNSRDFAGPAVCFMNFSFYLAVAVFGNAVGSLLNAFQPEYRNGVQIYPGSAYATVFAVLTLCAVAAFVSSFFLREKTH